MDTKACNLTEDEIKTLIDDTGIRLSWPDADIDSLIDRLNYLNKRLKAFKEVEEKPKAVKEPVAQGWPTNG